MKFAFGALYYKENVEDNAQAFNTNTFTDAIGSAYTTAIIDPATQRIDRASRVKSTSMGVYGQATYTPPMLNDIAHLTVGARYTHDKKVGSLFTINNLPPTNPGQWRQRNRGHSAQRQLVAGRSAGQSGD